MFTAASCIFVAMHTRILFLALGISLSIFSCGPQKSATPADAPQTDAPTDGNAEASAPAPEPNYTTVKGTGALAGLIPDGYEIVKGEAGEIMAIGELNGDNFEDAAILIQTLDEEQGSAAILVVHGEAGDKFRFGEMSGNLGPEPLSYPDPEQLKIEKGVLIFHYQSMRWSADLKFRKEAKYGDLRLIGTDTDNYGNAVHDGAGSSSTNYLTGQRISNYMSWDESKGDLVELPEKREKVSTQLRAFSGYNDDSLYNGL